MPVRVRSRALSLQKPDELEREWDSLKYSLVSLMLATSRLQNLLIHEKNKGKRISIRLGAVSPRKDEVDLGRIGAILAQSSLTNAAEMSTWHIVSAVLPDLAIRAAISTIPGPSKRLQFISLNDNPVLSRHSSNILFQEINRLFACSDFGNTGSISRGASLKCPSLNNVGSDGGWSASGSNWAKPVCKWPMFYIRIEATSIQNFSVESDEAVPDSEKSIQRITDVLGVLIVEFLRQQGLRPRMTRRQGSMLERAQQTTASDTSQRGVERSTNARRQDSEAQKTEEALNPHFKLPSFQGLGSAVSVPTFTHWSRIKAAKGVEHDTPSEHHTSTALHENEGQWRQPALRPRVHGSRTRHPETRPPQTSKAVENQIPLLAESNPTDVGVVGEGPNHSLGDHLIPWVDPSSGKKHMINSRTGQTVERKASDSGPRIWPGSFARASRQHNQAQKSHTTSSTWADDLLNAWENPAFHRTEKQVSSLDIASRSLHGHDSHACLHGIATLDATQVAKFRGKLQRQSLATAAIITQVDQKFILAKLPIGRSQFVDEEPQSALVLIDQHAADERRRVEQLFEGMFVPSTTAQQAGQVRTVEIDPITFGVSATESALFHKYTDCFAEWGIRYHTSTEPGASTVISVRTLPVLIAERCRLEPSVLIDLLRREIWASEEDDGNLLKQNPKTRCLGKNAVSFEEVESSPGISESSGTPPSWVQRMSRCPQGIVELLNSRACRSAIMFNDPLSTEECKTLVSQLAECVFPYQCAHGRPSMVPLLDLRSGSHHDTLLHSEGIAVPGYDEEHSDPGFVEAFRRRYVR